MGQHSGVGRAEKTVDPFPGRLDSRYQPIKDQGINGESRETKRIENRSSRNDRWGEGRYGRHSARCPHFAALIMAGPIMPERARQMPRILIDRYVATHERRSRSWAQPIPQEAHAGRLWLNGSSSLN